jgi:hypothetical protein
MLYPAVTVTLSQSLELSCSRRALVKDEIEVRVSQPTAGRDPHTRTGFDQETGWTVDESRTECNAISHAGLDM